MKKEILGKCMLLMSALIWGSSFIVMKNAVDFISPFTLLCIRFVLSTIFISILFFNKIKKAIIGKITIFVTNHCLFYLNFLEHCKITVQSDSDVKCFLKPQP